MLGIISLAVLVILASVVIIAMAWKEAGPGVIILVAWLVAFSALLGGIINEEIFPTAMDVYRHKTTLQINKQTTGRITIIKDSMVVFKPEFK